MGRGAVVLLAGALLVACSAPQEAEEEELSDRPSRAYHVQVMMTEDKPEAVRARNRAQRWWEERSSAQRPPLLDGTASSGRAVTIEWKTPFYRVRLGPFADRSDAESVLEAARSTFPDAFVVPVRLGSE